MPCSLGKKCLKFLLEKNNVENNLQGDPKTGNSVNYNNEENMPLLASDSPPLFLWADESKDTATGELKNPCISGLQVYLQICIPAE